MSWSSSQYGGDGQRSHDSYNQARFTRQPYDDRSHQAGPSTRPYYAPSHGDPHRDRYGSYSQQSYQSWDQQRQPQYPYSERYEPNRGGERRRDEWAAEPVRTQPGHDHFYDQTYGADRYAWASDRYTPSYRTYDSYQPEYSPHRPVSQQRSYSTQSYRRDEEDRYRPLSPARPSTQAAYPSNRRVSELAQKKEPTSYVPPHRRGQSAPVAEGPQQAWTRPLPPWRTTYNSPATSSYADTSFDTPTSKSRPNQEFVVTLPSSRYIALSDPARAPLSRNGPRTKLLVLDLNGALIYRTKHSGDKRRSFPRPYLSSFLEYLFLPEPDVDGEKRERGWEVFVWSSAQPRNVRAMVEGCFGMKWVEGVWEDEADEQKREREERGEGRLLGVWARDKLGLDDHDYRRKVQTVKDLRVLSNHLSTLPPRPNDPNSILEFGESNMVLLDDSPLKAIHQPWNEIILPEYEKEGYQTSKSVAELSDSQGYAEGMDDALLCVVGMLEGMRDIHNVPAWIRGGGLTPSAGPETAPPATSVTPLQLPDLTLDSLPTHSTFVHWHSIPEVRHYWLVKGLEALERKGIEIRHGIDPAPPSTPGGRSPMWSAPTSSGRPSKEMNRMNNDEICIDEGSELGSPKCERKGGWSPSRRNTPSPSPVPRSPPVTNSLPLLGLDPLPSTDEPYQSHPLPSNPIPQHRSQPSRPAQQPDGEEDDFSRRTFSISDVAGFLFELSHRVSTSLTAEQRQHLGIAGNILASLPAEDETKSSGDHTASSRKDPLQSQAERGGPTSWSGNMGGEDQVAGRDIEEGVNIAECVESGGAAQNSSRAHTKRKTPSVTQTIPPTHIVNTGRSKPNDQPISTVTFRPGGQIIINKGRPAPPSQSPNAPSAITGIQSGAGHDTSDVTGPSMPAPKHRLHKRDIAALDRLQQYVTAHTALTSEAAQAETHPVGQVPGKHISAIRKYHKALQRLEGELRTGKKIPEVINFLKGLPNGGVLPGQKILDQVPPHIALPSDNLDRPKYVHETNPQSGLLKAAKDAVDRLIDGQTLGGSYVDILVAEAKRELGIGSDPGKKAGRLAKKQAKGKKAALSGTTPLIIGSTAPFGTGADTFAKMSLSTECRTVEKDHQSESQSGPEQTKRSYDTALGGKADSGGSKDGWPPKDMSYTEVAEDDGGPELSERTGKRAKHSAGGQPSELAVVASVPDFTVDSLLTTALDSHVKPSLSVKEPLHSDTDLDDNQSMISRIHDNSHPNFPPSEPVHQPEVTAESHPDLWRWSNHIYLHRRIPEGGRGHLTFLVIKQIYQDLQGHTPHSSPSHIGEAVLSEKYPLHLNRLLDKAAPRPEPSDRAVVNLALEESKRFILVKSYPLVEDIPKPESTGKETIDEILKAAARDLPPLETRQVSHETAVALAARRETGPPKNSQAKMKKNQGKGVKRKQPASHRPVQPFQAVIEGSNANFGTVDKERMEKEQWSSRKKQKKMYTATNKDVVLVKHLPTLAQLGTYKDEEWV